jgi:hypothetical protein
VRKRIATLVQVRKIPSAEFDKQISERVGEVQGGCIVLVISGKWQRFLCGFPDEKEKR